MVMFNYRKIKTGTVHYPKSVKCGLCMSFNGSTDVSFFNQPPWDSAMSQLNIAPGNHLKQSWNSVVNCCFVEV